MVETVVTERTCRECGRVFRVGTGPASGATRCPPCRGVVAEVIVPLLDPDHDEKTEPSEWGPLDEEGFPF